MLFRADKITVTINNDLTIPLEFFNQYEPNNTIQDYDNIWYGGINDISTTITDNTQVDISIELENEIKSYIDNVEIYKNKEYFRLNPKLTIQQIKNKIQSTLLKLYNSSDNWFFTLRDGNYYKTQQQDWFLYKISTLIILHDDTGALLNKTITVGEVFEIKDLVNSKGFELSQLLRNLQNEINQVHTINDLAQYTEQYFKNRFNEINKIIRID
jgi:hypothetical protein